MNNAGAEARSVCHPGAEPSSRKQEAGSRYDGTTVAAATMREEGMKKTVKDCRATTPQTENQW